MQYFKGPLWISLLGLLAAMLWGGFSALLLTGMLSILEISISFDNAVVNAARLQTMNKLWQDRFLTWGIFCSVFIVRILLPIIIVALLAHLSIIEVIWLAFKNPNRYSQYLIEAHYSLSAFGGTFLLLVFLSFLFDQQRNTHWLDIIEKKLKAVGRLTSAEILIALLILLGFQAYIPLNHRLEVMVAGCLAIIIFGLLNCLTVLLKPHGTRKKQNGLISFVYLEVFDASFSLDSVISAFAITKDIIIILLGISLGAIFVRALTLFLVHHKMIHKFCFLEHGAFYAVGALGILMLLNILIPIPELITGLIGIGFVGLSLISSILRSRVH